MTMASRETRTDIKNILWKEESIAELKTFNGYFGRKERCPESQKKKFCRAWLRFCQIPKDWKIIWNYYPNGFKETDITEWFECCYENFTKCEKEKEFTKLFKECPDNFKEKAKMRLSFLKLKYTSLSLLSLLLWTICVSL